MSAMQVFEKFKVPAELYQGKSPKEQNALARALDPTFKVPPTANVEIISYTTTGNKKTGMYLSIKCGAGYKGIFEKLNEGDKLTDEGRAKGVQLLSLVVNGCGELLESL